MQTAYAEMAARIPAETVHHRQGVSPVPRPAKSLSRVRVVTYGKISPPPTLTLRRGLVADVAAANADGGLIALLADGVLDKVISRIRL